MMIRSLTRTHHWCRCERRRCDNAPESLVGDREVRAADSANANVDRRPARRGPIAQPRLLPAEQAGTTDPPCPLVLENLNA